MSPWGALIMGFFGSVFCVAAIVLAAGWQVQSLIFPVLVFAAIATMAVRLIRRTAPGAYSMEKRAGRVILWASTGEGIGIAIVVNVLNNMGRQALILPGVAMVVGLHFLPMAYGIPFRRFYLIGAVLILAAVAGFLLRQPQGAVFAGLVAAFALWAASVLALRAQPRSTVV